MKSVRIQQRPGRVFTHNAQLNVKCFRQLDRRNPTDEQLTSCFRTYVPFGEPVFHQCTIRVLNGKRNALQKHLNDQGVSSMVYYPLPLHKMKVFSNGSSELSGSLGIAELASQEVLSLPIEPLQKQEETTYVIDCIKGFYGVWQNCSRT